MPNFLQGLVLTVALIIAGFGWHLIYDRFSAAMIQNAVENQQMKQRTAIGPPPLLAATSSREIKTWYAYNEPLPAGYKCSAADGIVYRTTKSVGGASVLEPLVADHVLVRCAGDQRSSHRWTPPAH